MNFLPLFSSVLIFIFCWFILPTCHHFSHSSPSSASATSELMAGAEAERVAKKTREASKEHLRLITLPLHLFKVTVMEEGEPGTVPPDAVLKPENYICPPVWPGGALSVCFLNCYHFLVTHHRDWQSVTEGSTN